MYKRVIFPIDISDENSWNTAFPVVVNLVKAFNADLHVITVIPDYGMSIVQQYFPKGWLEEIVSKANKDLEKIIQQYVPEDLKVTHSVGRGAVYQCILDMAEQVNGDLIAMSANRPELKDYLLGPNAAKVVRHSKISVLVLRD